MWSALGLIGWTHLGYPAVAGLAARRRPPRPPLEDSPLPSVVLVIAAHNERSVIERRLENALALDYPADRLTVVVSVDGSTDGTSEIAERFAGRGVQVIDNPRAGKVSAQNAAVRATSSEIVAFSDANSMWDPEALQRLVRAVRRPRRRLRLRAPAPDRPGDRPQPRGPVLELRAVAARAGVAPRVDHGRQRSDLRRPPIRVPRALGGAQPRHRPPVPAPARRPRLAVRAAGRGDGAGGAVDVGRVGAQGADALPVLVRRAARRDAGPARVAGRLLRRARLAPAAAVRDRPAARAGAARRRWRRRAAAAAGGSSSRPMRGWLALALAGRSHRPPRRLGAIAWYYLVVTAASSAGLARMIGRGPQATWTPADGTR